MQDYAHNVHESGTGFRFVCELLIHAEQTLRRRSSSPHHLRIGSQNNIVYGTQLNGFSHNNPYGDDKQSDTNFPLARLTWANRHGNTCSPGVRVLRFSHDDGPAGPNVHSIAPGHFGFTHVDLPSMPEGTYSFVTVNQRHSVEHG